MRTKTLKSLCLVMALICCMTQYGRSAEAAPNRVQLSGAWRVRLDPKDEGARERWFGGALKESKPFQVPGTLSGQGIGDDVSLATPWIGGIQDPHWTNNPIYRPFTTPGNFKFPFWLQPDKYYAGAAWYQREIVIPEQWTNHLVKLTLERVHWGSQVWLDDRLLGTNASLSTPHVYDLGIGLAPGKHLLTVRVDNRLVIDVGINSHCVTDHTQGNWNGVVGETALEAVPGVWVEDLQVYPDLSRERVVVRGRVGNATGKEGKGEVAIRISERREGDSTPAADEEWVPVKWDGDGGSFERVVRVKKPKAWDEFAPNLYQCQAELKDHPSIKGITFGFRDFSAKQTQFVINGRPVFFRGTLECCIFPLTGHPPTEEAAWRRVIQAAKAHGLNMLRFHSYCPPEAAFRAADALGFYYQVETCWPNQSTTLGDGKPGDKWVYEETDRILKEYGNHPSFVLMAHGNEPGGAKANAYLARYVDAYKAKDPRRLWTSGAGWPQLPENQFHVTPDPRIQAWGDGLKSRINAHAPETRTDYREYIAERSVPVISHEIGQWCVYPNFDEIPKYTGYLKPRNFEIFKATLEARGMGKLAKDFLLASGKLQTLCYKEDIESALRTPGMGGFQLLDLHDFPGQGTALVGVLDPFWDSKGYVTPEEFRRFCNATVPLARLPKRVFTVDETLEADLDVAHFGPREWKDAVMTWSIEGEGGSLKNGQIPLAQVPFGSGVTLGNISVELRGLPAPASYKLVVGINPVEPGEKAVTNDWDIWVYPGEQPAEAGDVLVVSELSDAARVKLESGGRVLLSILPSQVAPGPLGRVSLGFSSIFWNSAWTGGQPPHTLGILCNPRHPLFDRFPTESHSNWQWWYLINRAGAMHLDISPKDAQPLVQVIDDWVTNRKLGLAFEATVGKGKLLVTSIDLVSEMSGNPVARQFLSSLLAYMNSSAFAPSFKLDVERIASLYVERSALKKLGGRIIRASSAQPGHDPDRAVDGHNATFWHSNYEGQAAGFPQELALALNEAVSLKGLSITQRQDGNRNGWVRDYEVYASTDWREWGKPVARGTLKASTEQQFIQFETPRKAQFLRFVALSGYSNGPWAAVAEIEVLR